MRRIYFSSKIDSILLMSIYTFFAPTLTQTVHTTNQSTSHCLFAFAAFIEGSHGFSRIPNYDTTPKVNGESLEKILDEYALPSIEVYIVLPPGTLWP